MATYEIEITTSKQTLDIGSPGLPLMADLEVYNGKVGLIIPNDFPTEIPGGVINVDDTLIVRLINDLPAPIETGIHWHGIELQNNADGTPVTQAGVPGGDLQVLGGGGDTVGGTYLYKFKVTRPGIFWFHPHHFHSTNRVFRGTYGMLVVTDPNETALIASDTIPDASQTEQLVLSDITVCGAPGNPVNNPPYDPTLPWVGPGGVLPVQPGFTPEEICDTNAVDENGVGGPAFNLGNVPNIQRPGGRVNEGLIVLNNGKNVGGRAGTPTAPGSIDGGAILVDVQPGQGLRLQIVNCATTRYFRLLLTTNTGTQVDLIRIGGEAGLLDNALLEGGTISGYDTKYNTGEILLPPAARADVVVAIPDDGTTDLTLWTQDFERLPGSPPMQLPPYASIPTVPVMHLNVTGAAVTPAFTITGGPHGAGGTPLRTATGDLVDNLGAATASLLDPATFSPVKDGMSDQNITLTSGTPSINSIAGDFGGFSPYSSAPHINSSRYAKEGDLLELTVENTTGAHHPFHLHGFSFQPISITDGAVTLNWGYNEFVDTIDIPNGHTLTFRVQIEDARAFADDSLANTGGSLGRWLFHCHIFFHAHRGMISELVVTDKDNSGDEKPNIDVGGSWTYAPSGNFATRFGTYNLPDGDTLNSIIAHLDDGTPIGDINVVDATRWTWQSHTPPAAALPDQTSYVYVTITGNSGRKDQTVFRLQIGGADEGSDNGDPHIRTIDGTNYDFQSVGEFTLLADRDGMEIQTRQTPVLTATPITNPYTGLTSCVSVNTAMAARLGAHYISYQPGAETGTLDFFVDGKPSRLTTRTLNLDNNLVRGIEIDGKMTLRIDYLHGAVVIVTPRFWGSNNIHYMNISISHTHGNEGLMGKIQKGNWLPKLRSGASLGPKPKSLEQRYEQLYKTFADSWRVTDKTSLFTYLPGSSTATFTDEDWPTFQPPCKLKPQFEIPGAMPQPAIPEDEAKLVCKDVTEGDLFQNCVKDVSATGEKSFADGYLLEQRIRLCATSVQIASVPDGNKIKLTALVTLLNKNGKKPSGKVTFFVNGVQAGQPVDVDADGQATITLDRPKENDNVTATYDGGDEDGLSSSSGTLPPAVDIGNDTDKSIPWYIWLLIIFLLLLIIVFLLY